MSIYYGNFVMSNEIECLVKNSPRIITSIVKCKRCKSVYRVPEGAWHKEGSEVYIHCSACADQGVSGYHRILKPWTRTQVIRLILMVASIGGGLLAFIAAFCYGMNNYPATTIVVFFTTIFLGGLMFVDS